MSTGFLTLGKRLIEVGSKENKKRRFGDTKYIYFFSGDLMEKGVENEMTEDEGHLGEIHLFICLLFF